MKYSVRLTQSGDIFGAFRSLDTKAEQRFRTLLRTQVRPAVLKDVVDFLAPYPAGVAYPFKFATDKSRRAFFATNGFGRGIPTRRSNQLYDSWDVKVTDRNNTSLLRVVNLKPYSQYVYAPRQVPGHRNTGWGKDFPTAIPLVEEHAEELVIDAWGDAIYGAVQGVR